MTDVISDTDDQRVSSIPPGPVEGILRRVKEDINYKPVRSPHVSLMGGDLASGVPYVIKTFRDSLISAEAR
jgi:hypothetical protein